MGANGFKCIVNASLGEIDPYRVSQKTYFYPKSLIWSLFTFISRYALLKTFPYTKLGIQGVPKNKYLANKSYTVIMHLYR